MQNVYDLVDLADVNEVIRTLDFDELVLGRYLPNMSYDRTSFRVLSNSRDTQRAARYIAFDREAPIGGRPGMIERQGAMPPIKEKSPLTESEQYALEALSGELSAALVASIYSDAVLRTRAILQRLEIARGEVLSAGVLTINEGRLNVTLDFGVPAAHMDVSPGTLWSDTTNATPLSDLTAWRDTYAENTGEQPGAIVVSSTVASLLQRNAEMIGAYASDRNRITRTEVNDLLASEELPTITVYDSMYRDVSGAKVRAIPSNRVLFLPSNPADLGETQLGRTREAVELAGAGVDLRAAGGLPGLVVSTLRSWDPIAVWTKAAGIGLPVLHTPELVFSAVVTA